MEYYLTGLIIIFTGGLTSLIFAEKHKATLVAIFSFLGTASLLIPAFTIINTGKIIESIIYLPEPIGKIPVVIDPLAAFYILVISIMSFLTTVYASGYIKPYLNKNNNISSHFLFLSILICSMLAVVTIQNAIAFLIVWEIMSLSSFFLVIFENNKKETLSAGINYLIYMHICVIFLVLGFIMLYLKSGSLEFSSFKATLETNKIFAEIIFILLFIGFGTKAGFVPFHNWLPKAHPAAPSHVSAIMSGVMIKTGIYGILRVLTFIGEPSVLISYFILLISVISALYGVLYAIAQHDLKRLLAYHSIENIGIIGIGIGVGMLGQCYNNNLIALLGFSGAILHVLNHSIFKELLFLSAGAVYKHTYTKDIHKLGGLIKAMPATAFMFLIASVAISGLPPLNGFISEFLIYFGMLKGTQIYNIQLLIAFVFSTAALAFVGTMALLCFTKAYSIVFLGTGRSVEAKSVESDTSKSMLVPMAILAVLTILIGLFPNYAIKIVINPVNTIIGSAYSGETQTIILNLMSNISMISFAFIAIIIVLFAVRKILLRNTIIEYGCTWGCGYKKINNRMQYTAASYASPFLSMMAPFLITHYDITKPKELFPKECHFKFNIEDIEEFYFVKPLIKADEKFLSKFQWMQGGNTQQYILYGLIFLVMALLGTFL